MWPTWGLSAPDGPHIGPMKLAIRDPLLLLENELFEHATLTSDVWFVIWVKCKEKLVQTYPSWNWKLIRIDLIISKKCAETFDVTCKHKIIIFSSLDTTCLKDMTDAVAHCSATNPSLASALNDLLIAGNELCSEDCHLLEASEPLTRILGNNCTLKPGAPFTNMD